MPAKEAPKETKKETPTKEAPKETKKETPKEAQKAAPAKEGAKEAQKEAKPKTTPTKESPKEAPKEAPKETKPAQPKAAPTKESKPAQPKAAQPAKAKQPVPETILKRRSARPTAEQRQKHRVALKKHNSKRRAEAFKRAEQYVKEYRAQERSLIHFRRQARNNGNFFIEPEPKLVFVIRVRGIMNLHPKPKKILQILRLRQVNNGVFLKLNKSTLQMLHLVEPYVTWGAPNLKSVRELIYKRGFLKSHQQRIPITDNKMIEQRLSHHGCVCIEDIIHQVFKVGEHFTTVNRALWAFQLNPPKGGYRRVNRHYNDGGDFGNREDKINELIRSMN